MAFKVITDDNKKLCTSSILFYTDEPMESNLHLDSLCGETYPFIKSLPYRDKKIMPWLDNYSKPELVSRENEDDEYLL